LLILAGGMTSCIDHLMNELQSNNTVNNEISLEVGLYAEVEPIRTPEEMGYSTINFIDEKRLVITKYIDNAFEGDIAQEIFIYEISENTIRLTSIVDPSVTTEHYFRIISRRKFEIGYLHFRTGFGEPPSPMTFERKQTN